MENYQGDLTDIIRATSGGGGVGGGGGGNISGEEEEGISLLNHDWQFSANPMNMNYHQPSCGLEEKTVDEEFGDPFSNRRDPLLLLHLQDPPPPPPAGVLCSTGGGSFNRSGDMMKESSMKATTTDCFGGHDGLHHHKKIIEQEDDDDDGDDDRQQMMKKSNCRPANIFSRMLQISPPPPPPPPQLGTAAYPLINIPPNGHEMMMISQNHPVHNNLITSKSSCLAENNGGAVQISSPRNTGIKRRKSQAKKVVCIPAPSPANSRPSSGEVVPSDLWAWRKYGQKPIKGSPYPRGYYRCSSSKGCSARKQVERSRTDPNMLVITYTSEHNHPWPTQRNALAGSTRAQPTKGNVSSSKIREEKSTTSSSSNSFLKEEEHNNKMKKKKNDHRYDHHDDGTELPQTTVKEELVDDQDDDDDDNINYNKEAISSVDDQVMSELGFPLESYRPAILSPPAAADGGSLYSSTNNIILPRHHLHGHHHDFFAGLAEIETDPLNLLFTQGGFSGQEEQHELEVIKPSDPFTALFDWAAGRDDTSNTSFGDQAKNKS